MRGDVLNGEVADREQIANANHRGCDARCSAQRGIASAGDQFVVFEADAEQRRNDGVRRYHPGKRQGELA